MSISIITLILAAIFIYFILLPQRDSGYMYKVVAAGFPGRVNNLVLVRNDLHNTKFIFDGKTIDSKKYEICIVKGESMAKCGIHTDNGVLINRDFEKTQLASGTVVIYKVNKERFANDHPGANDGCCEFKARQLLGYVQIDDDNEVIFSVLAERDPDLKKEAFHNMLDGKLKKARSYYGNTKQTVTISITEKDGSKDYSVHTLNELYGVVSYIIPKEQIGIVA